MDNIKDDKYYINKIVDDINRIQLYINDAGSIDNLVPNTKIYDAILFRLLQISENIDNFTDQFKVCHSSIKWHQIRGFRNVLVHDYGGVDNAVVIDILKNHLNPLKNELLK